jgi:hypothetical protein
MIPRALWTDKVIFMDSGLFANMQGWTHGGLSLTTPGSFFWAWDYVGIIVGMTATGFALAWLRTRGQGETSGHMIAQLLQIALVIELLDVGVTFHHVYMGLSRNLVLLLLIRWGLRVLLRSHQAT